MINFLVREWEKAAYTKRLKNTVLMIGYGTECVKLSSNCMVEIPELSCFYEEPDTRMLFNATYASEEDTDMMFIALPSALDLKLLQRRKNQNQTRLIDLKSNIVRSH